MVSRIEESGLTAGRLPTMEQAVEIIAMQLSRGEQGRQLRFMADTQGEKFAQQVKAKVRAAGKARKA